MTTVIVQPGTVQILCGLYRVDVHTDSIIPSAPIPLHGVHVEANVVDMVTEVTLTQQYSNYESVPIEARYVFPLDEGAAVCEFEAEIDGQLVSGVVKEKEEARREYTEAVARGDGAYLLEQARADIFSIKVGNLPPGKTCAIRITYIVALKVEGDAVRFLLPTTVAPRYTPYRDTQEAVPSTGVISHFNYWGLGRAPYGLSLNVNCEMRSPITKASSPTHGIAVTQNSATPQRAQIALAAGLTALDRDLIVLVETQTPHEPRLCLETDPEANGSRAMMLTLVPHFELDDIKCEVIFVVDRSGSMGGSQILQARNALTLFLKSLPTNSRFNIVGFGDSYQTLFPEAVGYSQANLNTALKHVSTMDANLGGTELLAPLRAIERMKTRADFPRQVFVLTDGQVSNTDQVIAQVNSDSKNARYFALGIGSGVSHHLVEGIARAGKGNAQFVVDGERMETKVMRQLKDAIQPSLTDVRVNWGLDEIPAAVVEPPKVKSLLGYKKPEPAERPFRQAPFTVPPVFDGSRFLIFAFLKPGVPAPKQVTIHAISPDGPLEVALDVKEEETLEGNTIHRMAARTMIRDLEEGTSFMHQSTGGYKRATDDAIKKEIVRLGTTYSLASRHTSFIAIEKRPNQPQFQSSWFGESYIVPKPQPVVRNTPTLSPASSISAPLGGRGGYGGGAPRMRSAAPPTSTSSNSGFFGQVTGAIGSMFGSSPAPPPPAPGGAAPMQAQAQRLSYASAPSAAPSPMAYESYSADKRKKSRSSSGSNAMLDGAVAKPAMAMPSMSFARSSAAAAAAPMPRKEKEMKLSRASSDDDEEEAEGFGLFADDSVNECMMAAELGQERLDLQPQSLFMAQQQSRPAGRAADPSQTLQTIVNLQLIDGAFEPTQALATALGVAPGLFQTLAASLGVSAGVVAAALALAYLQTKLSQFAEDWEMIANKANSWLKKTLKAESSPRSPADLVREVTASL
ncbi:von Willebrand domain-containing protein [Capsaspora owczarzaki ATCC 30864]|uniref:von Willebrand domain-containing protein n=1 Tax=Capsaspora owczarzaki (strain ATCC 30864) TaxID=595528 RepID=A0A0D2VSI5_CAPO3|nr:von Willebrand domain-containing protein [Capsaspora owczarzaki ATCC 30864]KJE94062.1 von Willebrand domain-containing protein [Capsaspora owczarzaki ATCC 30864]|eukprot:XP_004347510.1 von Willebrand domain-containing protein [Capsaspora owczarzaki ATCC 30864]